MTTPNPLESRSATSPSTTRSAPPEPRWAKNWKLLRGLFPDWNPTPDQVAQVWFRSFDKPHARKGEDTIDHDLLADSIRHSASVAKGRIPRFEDIATRYSIKRSESLSRMERESLNSRDAAERIECENQHVRRVSIISSWSLERRQAAERIVKEIVPIRFRNESNDPGSWSAVYSGLVWAADQKARG